jgi:hypothetical protein
MPRLFLATVLLFALGSPASAQQADRGLAAVPTDAFGFVSVKVSQLWDNPAAKSVRDWVDSQKGSILDSVVGVPFSEIDRVTVFLPSWDPGRETSPVVLVSTRRDYRAADVCLSLGLPDPIKWLGRLGERRVATLAGHTFAVVMFVDSRTMAFFFNELDDGEQTAELMAQLLARKPDGPLASALAKAESHDIVAGIDIKAIESRLAVNAGKELLPFKPLFAATSAMITADVKKTVTARFAMSFPDADSAKAARPALEQVMTLLEGELIRASEHPRGDPLEKLIDAWGATVLKGSQFSVEGSNLIASADVKFADDLTKLVTILPKSLKIDAEESTTLNNLKILGIAMLNFGSAHNRLPSDVPPWDKRHWWSWRIQVLPYIEQDNRYRLLDFTKPWNDPANLKVLESAPMPKFFERPGRPAAMGHTYY